MPDTAAYLIYGYIVIFGILGAYILSLVLKSKKIRKELQDRS
ncbi:MAG: CcmD family protein [Anaerolineaceae bacterium]|nr:CcmD family protein [Anaerolineaceae bacterium]